MSCYNIYKKYKVHNKRRKFYDTIKYVYISQYSNIDRIEYIIILIKTCDYLFQSEAMIQLKHLTINIHIFIII